jgi:hypothetical protein
VFHWQVAVVNTNDEGGFESMGSEWSAIRTLNRVRRFTLDPLPVEMQSDMAQYISAQEFDTPFEMINFTRDFIHNHTTIQAEGDYAVDYSDAMQLVFNHFQGIGEAPVLYCNGMSTGMLTIFRELGLESRLIFLFAEARGWIARHTFLEIFNTETQQWEVHDPTFNLYFVDIETGEHATVERMIFGDLDTLVGCNTAGECSHTALAESVQDFLGAYTIGHGSSGEYWVNPDKLDITRRVSALENNNFPEFVSRLSSIPQRDLIFTLIIGNHLSWKLNRDSLRLGVIVQTHTIEHGTRL